MGNTRSSIDGDPRAEDSISYDPNHEKLMEDLFLVVKNPDELEQNPPFRMNLRKLPPSFWKCPSDSTDKRASSSSLPLSAACQHDHYQNPCDDEQLNSMFSYEHSINPSARRSFSEPGYNGNSNTKISPHSDSWSSKPCTITNDTLPNRSFDVTMLDQQKIFGAPQTFPAENKTYGQSWSSDNLDSTSQTKQKYIDKRREKGHEIKSGKQRIDLLPSSYSSSEIDDHYNGSSFVSKLMSEIIVEESNLNCNRSTVIESASLPSTQSALSTSLPNPTINSDGIGHFHQRKLEDVVTRRSLFQHGLQTLREGERQPDDVKGNVQFNTKQQHEESSQPFKCGPQIHMTIENSPNEDHMLAPKIRTSPNTPYLTVPEISHSKQNSGDSGIGLTNDFDLMDMLDASPFSHDAFLPSELDLLLEDVNTPPQLENRIVDN